MRIIKISKCEDCPYFEYAYTNDPNLYICEHIDANRKIVVDKTIIQDFCPLEEEGNDVCAEFTTNRHD